MTTPTCDPYLVEVREVYVQVYRVVATDPQDAIARLAEGEGKLIENAFEYSHTLDSDTWTATKVTAPEAHL